MTLSTGTPPGSFEVLGAGGRGEDYRARDTRLGRQAAIEGLPAAFARHSERLTRFEREARLPASLDHPGVAVLYGLEAPMLPASVHALVREVWIESGLPAASEVRSG